MPETFCALLTAYLLGTFVLPVEWMSQPRHAVRHLTLRAAVVLSASCLLLGTFHWRILLAILLTLVLMAILRAYVLPDSVASFLLDQCAHLVVLLGLAFYFADAARYGWWSARVPPDLSKWYFASLSCVSGVILCVPAGGVLIAMLTKPFTREIRDNDIAGLTHGGKYIGWLERILVMLLVLMGQPGGDRLPDRRKVDPSIRRDKGREPAQSRRVHHYRDISQLWLGIADLVADAEGNRVLDPLSEPGYRPPGPPTAAVPQGSPRGASQSDIRRRFDCHFAS